MAFDTHVGSVTYTGSGTATTFAVTFAFISHKHVVARLKLLNGAVQTLQEGTDYTLTGERSPTGGTLTLLNGPLPQDVQLVLLRVVPLTQGIQLPAYGPLAARTIEDALDLGAMRSQAETAARAELEDRLDVVDEAFDNRAAALEGRATALEAGATALDGRATALEGRATALEAKPTSQWTTGAGGVISYSGGNVGIGTTNPTVPLSVAGEAKVGGNFSVLTGTTSLSQLSVTSWATVSGNATVSGDFTVDGATLKVDSLNDRVGVGTATPTATLDVAGSVKVSGGITAISGLTTLAQANVNGAVNATSATVTGNLTVDTDTLRVDAATNRVGVGTASPTERLEVAGNLKLTGAAGTDGVVFPDGTKQTTAATGGGALDSRVTTLEGTTTTLGTRTTALETAFNMSGHRLDYRVADLEMGWSNVLKWGVDEDIGMGLVDRAINLDARATTLESTTSSLSTRTTALEGTTGTLGTRVTALESAGGGGSSQWVNGAGGVISYSGGFVGVGTGATAPVGPLTVDDTRTANYSHNVELTTGASASTERPGLGFRRGGTLWGSIHASALAAGDWQNGLNFSVPSGKYFNFRVADVSALIINSSGNTGFGAASAAERVEVTGNLKVSSNIKCDYYSDAGGNQKIQMNSGGTVVYRGTEAAASTAKVHSFINSAALTNASAKLLAVHSDNGTTERFSVSQAGNVTVAGGLTVDGTTLVVDAPNNRVGIAGSPGAYTLDVGGTLNAGNSTLTSITTTGGVTVGSGLTVDSNTFAVDAADNEVGIGTAAPGFQLHVVNNTSGAQPSVVLDKSANNVAGATLTLRSSRGSAASPTATQSGDELGAVAARGYGTAYATADRAKISMLATELWSGTAHGTAIAFSTTTPTTTTTAERLRIDSGGLLFPSGTAKQASPFAPAYGRMHGTSSMFLQFNGPTIVPFDAATFAAVGLTATLGATARFTVPAGTGLGGQYLVCGFFTLVDSETGFSRTFVEVWKNGAKYARLCLSAGSALDAPYFASFQAVVPLAPGDYVDIRVGNVGNTSSNIYGAVPDIDGYTGAESYVDISRLCPST